MTFLQNRKETTSLAVIHLHMSKEKNMANSISRRGFVKAAGVALAAGSATNLSSPASAALFQGHGRTVSFSRGEVVLFQGDSITDAGRSRERAGIANEQAPMGNGYAWLAAAGLLVERPNLQLKIYNRGISGNKVYQLAERWEEDCLKLQPNVLSILIGVNDIWHKLDGKYNGTVEVYEK